tara:strand:- start:51 stop:569 length:519 start_codon:yes stop_codon:yes gene_type:complete
MRSLKSFLLEEAMLNEAKREIKVPEGFEKVETRGRITNQLKSLLNIQSAKELKLENRNLKHTTPEGRKAIIKDLELQGVSDFADVFRKIAKADKMEGVFEGTSSNWSSGSNEGKIIGLRKNYAELAGTASSTLRFIKFWCSCACLAAGFRENDVAKYEYFINTLENKILVVK